MERVVNTKFYCYVQNNPYGTFDIDKEDFDTPFYFNMNDAKDKCVVISNIYDNSMFDEYYRKRNK